MFSNYAQICNLRKSGDIQELFWSVEMEDKLDDFEIRGWKIQL
jgi:hypothetical protein